MGHTSTGTAFTDGGRRGSGGGISDWRPGWREAAVFSLLVVFGFVVWFAASPGITSMLLGVNLDFWSPNLPFISLTQILCGVAALVGGFVSPRGFYLWGIALALHSPFTQGLSVYLMEREGVELVGGTEGLVAFAVMTAVLISFATFCYSMLSAVGMGLRLLARRNGTG